MPPAIVQSKSVQATASGSSISLSFTTTPVAGRLVAVYGACDGPGTFTSVDRNVTDNQTGNTYTFVASRSDGATTASREAGGWYAGNINAGGTFTVTLGNVALTFYTLNIMEVSGLDTSTSVLNASASQADANAVGTAISTGSVTTTAANVALLGGATDTTASTDTVTPGTGFTDQSSIADGFNGIPLAIESQILSATQTINPGMTWSTSNHWGGVTMAFRDPLSLTVPLAPHHPPMPLLAF